jgi:hypothetical protein
LKRVVLPAPFGADEADDAARLDLEGQLVERDDPAEADAEVLNAEERRAQSR